MLGISGLQLVSLQNNRGALQRAEAVRMAYDMMDRIRANPAGIPAGSSYAIALAAAPPGGADCNAGPCTQNQMVAFDQAVWKCSLGDFNADATCTGFRNDGVLPGEDLQPGLPEGDGSVVVDNNGMITITVQWSERGGVTRTVSINSQS